MLSAHTKRTVNVLPPPSRGVYLYHGLAFAGYCYCCDFAECGGAVICWICAGWVGVISVLQ